MPGLAASRHFWALPGDRAMGVRQVDGRGLRCLRADRHRAVAVLPGAPRRTAGRIDPPPPRSAAAPHRPPLPGTATGRADLTARPLAAGRLTARAGPGGRAGPGARPPVAGEVLARPRYPPCARKTLRRSPRLPGRGMSFGRNRASRRGPRGRARAAADRRIRDVVCGETSPWITGDRGSKRRHFPPPWSGGLPASPGRRGRPPGRPSLPAAVPGVTRRSSPAGAPQAAVVQRARVRQGPVPPASRPGCVRPAGTHRAPWCPPRPLAPAGTRRTSRHPPGPPRPAASVTSPGAPPVLARPG